MNNSQKIAGPLVAIFTLAAIVLRPLPTFGLMPFHLVPVGALALYCGARWSSRLAYLVPVAVMIVTDLFLWLMAGRSYSPFYLGQPFVYGSFMLYVLLGRVLWKKSNPLWIAGITLAGSVQFFLVSNLGAWVVHPNTLTFAGLVQCLEAGLPMFRLTLLGDAVFSAVFFSIHALLARAGQPAALPASEPVLESATK